MKICNKCNHAKPLSEFHKNKNAKDGHQAYCNDCRRKYAIKHYHTERGRKTHNGGRQHYNKSKKGKATQKRQTIMKYKDHPEQCRASAAVCYAVRMGKLPPINTLTCYYCTHQAEDYHHYFGYKPEHYLDVAPACRMCHKAIHRAG